MIFFRLALIANRERTLILLSVIGFFLFLGRHERPGWHWVRALFLDTDLFHGVPFPFQPGVLRGLRAVAALQEKEGWPEEYHAYGHLGGIIRRSLFQAGIEIVSLPGDTIQFSGKLLAVVVIILQRRDRGRRDIVGVGGAGGQGCCPGTVQWRSFFSLPGSLSKA